MTYYSDTDIRISRLERRIRRIYKDAANDIDEKMDDFNRRYKVKEAIYAKQVKDGKITQEDFDAWKRGQVFQGRQWEAKKASIEDTLTNANEAAQRIVNGEKSKVFMANSNYQAYELEHGAGVNFGFNLYDSATVARIIDEEPNLLPLPSINVPKDKVWNSKNISHQIAQGIIQGESLDKIAKRLSKETGSKNMNSMLTNARTAMTGAQNAGRIVRLNEAKNKGIKVKKEWMATLDEHTRWQHADLDGQKVDTAKPFIVGGYSIMYPGDPHAHPSMIYNCRCTLVGDLEDYPSEYDRYDNIDGKPIKNMTYREWEKAKGVQYSKSQVINVNFYGIRKQLGDGFVDAMETLLNFTPETDAKDLFYEYKDRVKVTDANCQDGAYFSPTDGGIHVNASKVQQGDNLHVPYQTVFHEFGHNIDSLASSKGYGDNYISREYKSGLLSKKLKEDWQDFRVKYLLSHTDDWAKEDSQIRILLREFAEKENKNEPYKSAWYDLVRKHRQGEITTEEILSKYGEKIARQYLMDNSRKYLTDSDVIKMLENENMPLHARGSISDAIGGLMCSRGDNSFFAYPLGAGHEFDYWWTYKGTKAGEVIKVSSDNQPLEFFAEVLDAKVANPESLVQMRRVFPKSVKVVEQIIQEALKR